MHGKMYPPTFILPAKDDKTEYDLFMQQYPSMPPNLFNKRKYPKLFSQGYYVNIYGVVLNPFIVYSFNGKRLVFRIYSAYVVEHSISVASHLSLEACVSGSFSSCSSCSTSSIIDTSLYEAVKQEFIKRIASAHRQIPFVESKQIREEATQELMRIEADYKTLFVQALQLQLW